MLRRRGIFPDEQPLAALETDADVIHRYQVIARLHDRISELIAEQNASTLVIIGDDQNELFASGPIPQIAIFTGAGFRLSNHGVVDGPLYSSNLKLAQAILSAGIAEGFDIAPVPKVPDGVIPSHAHVQLLRRFVPSADLKVVLVFLNAVHYPAIEPRRCHAFGLSLRSVIENSNCDDRVIVAASGGWSHFTAGYPWDNYIGDHSYGAIDVSFDRGLERLFASGEAETLSKFTSSDLLSSGNIELRAWIALLGAMPNPIPQFLAYEPFYRAVMGMATATWSVGGSSGM